MKFATPNLELEFNALHPDVRKAIKDLDEWSKKRGFPEVVVTHCLRTRDDQERIYFKYVQGLRKKRADKVQLTAAEQRISIMSDKDAKAWAREKFSWHLVACAVDIRNIHYTRTQLLEVLGYLKTGRALGPWEILSHDVSNGNHIHVGVKDFAFRKKYTSATPSPVPVKKDAPQ